MIENEKRVLMTNAIIKLRNIPKNTATVPIKLFSDSIVNFIVPNGLPISSPKPSPKLKLRRDAV